MAFGSFVLTDFGLSLEAKMKAGKRVSITRVALGDGSIGTGSVFSVTRLKSERFSLPVSSVSHSSTEATVTAILTNEMLDEGFNLREMGLMATDPDTKIEGVYSYNRDSGEGEYLPDKNSSQRLKEYLKIQVKSSSTENIIFESVGSPADLTQEDMDEHNSSETAHLGLFVLTSDKGEVGGVATLDDTGKVPSEQLPTMNYDVAGAAAAVQVNLNTHKANKANPHGVTALQAGADPAGTAAAVQGNLNTHKANKANPHGVTASQAGADPAGSAAAVQRALNTHVGNTTPHITAEERIKWNAKQNKLTFDTTPKNGSTNPVTSGGVEAALSEKATAEHDHDERYLTKEQSLGAFVASGGSGDAGDLEDTTLETGSFTNTGAGWNTYRFREPFDAPPNVVVTAEDFEGVVQIKDITAEGFLYCLRVSATGSYYTATSTSSSSAHSAQTLVNGTTTTALAVKINYLAVEYGGER